jgi:ABC-2 type transport system ATP-binding protein
MSVFELHNLTKAYGSMVALNNVNLALESGRIVGLLGPNGSGKTTVIKLAKGLLQPTSGELLIDGSRPGPRTKSMVAYLPDRDFLPPYMKISEVIRFYQDFYADFDHGRAEAMLMNLGLNPTDQIRKLSKGNREKVELIMTMSRRAQVYLLDEPIAGVDPATRDYILHTIISNYSEEALMVISTHLITDVEPILDDIVFLHQGNVILHEGADELRERTGFSVDQAFRDAFRFGGFQGGDGYVR